MTIPAENIDTGEMPVVNHLDLNQAEYVEGSFFENVIAPKKDTGWTKINKLIDDPRRSLMNIYVQLCA